MLDALKPKTCPGIPSTVPPDIADYDDADEGGEGTRGATEGREERKRTIRFDDGDVGNRHAESLAIHNLQGFVSLRAGILILTGWCHGPFWSFSHLPCLPIGQEELKYARSVSAFLHAN